jgi:glycosyltransferase involved in cell wall biosynthesis
MRIALVAPLIESVPPRLYGGTERVVAFLAEELVRLGHDVTLFASGDSVTAATLVPGCDRALRLSPVLREPLPLHLVMLEKVRSRAAEFDVIHFHIDLLPQALFADVPCCALATLHGRLDLPDLMPFYRHFDTMPLVSISDHQRTPLPGVWWAKTVYHGLPEPLYRPVKSPRGDYVAFLGRISPEKRLDRAIAIAKAANMPLKIGAKVDPVDQHYFDTEIKPLLDHPLVSYVGEVDESGKNEMLANARALLFPIDWPEPFGLVMIESMACGTPVIAYPFGSVPEIIEPGLTGFLVDNIDQAVTAIQAAQSLDRRRIRARFMARFSARRMAEDYVALYTDLAAGTVLPSMRSESVDRQLPVFTSD